MCIYIKHSTQWTRVKPFACLELVKAQRCGELIIWARRFCLGIKVNFSLLWTTRKSFVFSFCYGPPFFCATATAAAVCPWVFKFKAFRSVRVVLHRTTTLIAGRKIIVIIQDGDMHAYIFSRYSWVPIVAVKSTRVNYESKTTRLTTISVPPPRTPISLSSPPVPRFAP